MKKLFSKLSGLRDQKGQALALVAVSMFMLIGFTAIVVDAGTLYLEKSQLQKALDAAVLGGAQKLKVSVSEAEGTATDLALQNGYDVSNGEVSVAPEGNSITAEKTVNKNLTFARILGIHDADVSALSQVKLVHGLSESEGAIPVGIKVEEFKEVKGKEHTLNLPGEEGDFGYLGIDGSDANAVESAIKHGSKRKAFEKFETSEPGKMGNKVMEAFQYRINQDQENNKIHCDKFETADNSCSRIAIVPVVKMHGGKTVEIIGFAAFWIEKLDGNPGHLKVKGRFIEMVASGTFNEDVQDFGIYGVKLER